MSHISQEARERAAETKKRKTWEKLIHACDFVMRNEVDSPPTVEAIAAQAGVSVATFYSFYSSRLGLCEDTFQTVVLVPLEEIGLHGSFEHRARSVAKMCEGRSLLIRGALEYRAGRQGHYGLAPYAEIVTVDGQLKLDVTFNGDAVCQVAGLLADTDLLEQAQEHEAQFLLALEMAALLLLERLGGGAEPDYEVLADVFMQGCMPH